jgi:putative transposase
MPRKGHSEEEIVRALRQAEGGQKMSEICREMGVSQQAFYSWKRRYAGLALSELRELRQLREENRKLKTLVADLTLDKHMGPILILENDVSIRNLLCRLLERRGYASVEIQETHDLAAELKARSAELLVIDVSTTKGVDTAIGLARIHPNLKILALVAGSLDGNAIPGRLQVLPKPFGLDSFVDCVDRLLERSASPETGER